MSNFNPLSLLAYFSESTQGTPPADAAAWISSGVRLRHIASSLDMSGVKRVLLADERNQYRLKGSEARVQGIDNPEFPFAVYGHGTGVTTAAGSQVATTAPGYELGNLLGHCLGGVSRGYSNAIVGATSTTTVLAVTDASDHAVGDFIAVQFATAVTNYPVTTCWPRRITAVDTGASPNTLTIDQALPQIPAAGDALHGTIVSYVDEDVLVDSSAASGRTRSWLVQKGLPGAGAGVRESWMFRGCVSTLQPIEIARGALKQFAFSTMAGSHADPTTSPWPTAWDTNAQLGLAPLSVTPITESWFVARGATTNTRIHHSSLTINPGVTRTRVETLTTLAPNMQGTASYCASPEDTTLSFNLTPFEIAQWTAQLAEQQNLFRWSRLGPAGSGLAIHVPRVSYADTPTRTDNGSSTDVAVQLLAHEETALGTTNLQQSIICIVQW